MISIVPSPFLTVHLQKNYFFSETELVRSQTKVDLTLCMYLHRFMLRFVRFCKVFTIWDFVIWMQNLHVTCGM